MRTITAKYSGRCQCGARVNVGDRVKWARGSGVQVCKACSLRVMHRETVEPYRVVVKGRDGQPSKVSVGVRTPMLHGQGAIHFDTEGKLTGVGAHRAMVRTELASHVPRAREAAMAVLEAYTATA